MQSVESLCHPVGSVELLPGIGGFRDTVSVDKQAVAGIKDIFVLPEADAFHGCDSGGVFIEDEFIISVFVADDRVLMACVRGDPPAGGQLEDGEPDRYKQVFLVSLTELVVDVIKDLSRRAAHLCAVFDQGLGDHHEQGCGHSLSGDVRHDQCQMVFIHQEKVVEIAAHFFGGIHGGIEVDLLAGRERRKDPGQHVRLDPGRNVQLCPDALLFGSDSSQVLYIDFQFPGHMFKGLPEPLQFVPGVDPVPEGTQRFHLVTDQLAGILIQDMDRSDQDPADIGIIEQGGNENDSQGDHEKNEIEPLDLMVDDIHGNVHAGQRRRLSPAVQYSHVGGGQVAVKIAIGDQHRLLGIGRKCSMHYLIAVAVVFIRVSQVTDALVALFARIPDVKLHILRDDDIQVFHTGALADHLQSLMDRLVIGILFEGFAVLGDPVSVDQLRGDRGRVKCLPGIDDLHFSAVDRPAQGCQGQHQDSAHDDQTEHQSGS